MTLDYFLSPFLLLSAATRMWERFRLIVLARLAPESFMESRRGGKEGIGKWASEQEAKFLYLVPGREKANERVSEREESSKRHENLYLFTSFLTNPQMYKRNKYLKWHYFLLIKFFSLSLGKHCQVVVKDFLLCSLACSFARQHDNLHFLMTTKVGRALSTSDNLAGSNN